MPVHQRDITSFWGGAQPKPKPITVPSLFASKARDLSSRAKEGDTKAIKREHASDGAPAVEKQAGLDPSTAGEENPSSPISPPVKLRRLRKGSKKPEVSANNARLPAAATSEPAASSPHPTVALASAPAASAPSAASPSPKKSRSASPAKAPSPRRASPRKKKAGVVTDSEDSLRSGSVVVDLDSSSEASSGDDLPAGYESDGKSPGPDDRVASGAQDPLRRKSAQTKVEGVGLGAIKAAAEHADVDVSKLVSWPVGSAVPFGFLADTFEAIAEESKRLVITRILVGAFRAVISSTPGDLLPMLYLCCNRVAPAHEGLELGIGDATLIKALAQVTGKKESAVKSEYGKCGDLGAVAAAARGTQRTMFPPPRLTVRGVLHDFKEIAASEGTGSQDRKKNLIVKLLVGSRDNEAGYVMRALQGKLRIGLAEQTVLVALAQAVELSNLAQQAPKLAPEPLAGKLEEAACQVKLAYSRCPSYDELVPALLSHGPANITTYVHFTPGVPVKPMLAKPTNGVSEVLDKFTDQPFTCEFKYDGERAQVHVLENGVVKIYSRNSEDNTGKFPDVAATVPRLLCEGISSVVLDAEIVAFDKTNERILPFQILSTRARKDVSIDSIKVAVCLYVFDCLYLNGEELLDRPLTERREAMQRAVHEESGAICFATAKTSTDVEELSRFLDEAVEAGTEGLIVKTLNDTYEPSRRSSHWLKLKKDYLQGVGDTFDVVPVGAWYGRGKRTGVYGSYLLAVYDRENEQYQTICKIGTGFSEELLKELAESLREHVIGVPRKYYRWGETLEPDVWFEPKAVWEVKAADLSISPVHKAAEGLVDPSKGISIRFPRLVRVRDDKGPEDTTSPEQIAEMYQSQAIVQQATLSKPDNGNDY